MNPILFFIYRILVNAIGIGVAAILMESVDISDSKVFLLTALAFTAINQIIKPLVVLFTLPFTILTFGFGYLLINALMLHLTSRLVDGFIVAGFWGAFGGSLLISFVNMMFDLYGGRHNVRVVRFHRRRRDDDFD